MSHNFIVPNVAINVHNPLKDYRLCPSNVYQMKPKCELQFFSAAGPLEFLVNRSLESLPNMYSNTQYGADMSKRY